MNIERWMDACHDRFDFEDIPPESPTLSGMAGNANIDTLLRTMRALGFTVTEEPGWLERNPTYNWYPGAPHGIMVHHTATDGYRPSGAYPQPEGDRPDGKTICNILIQPDGVLNFVSADPANYSSGLNWEQLLTDYVQQRRRFHGPQSGPLGPEWYGNRAWINIETVHPGDGSTIPEAQERSLLAVVAVMCEIKGWDSTAVIGHYDGRGTKIDPKWTGQVAVPPYSIAGIQDAVQQLLDANEIPQPPGGTMSHFKVGNDYPEYEQVAWMLHLIRGGTIDPDEPAVTQLVTTMPWKTSAVYVDADDFRYLCDLFGLTTPHCEELFDVGLNRHGKEIAQLRRLAYSS